MSRADASSAAASREEGTAGRALAPGGILVLHDVSEFAAGFDVTNKGGVRRAFSEWRKKHPEVETLSLNSNSRSMDETRPLYKDACGVGLIHKPQHV